MDAVIGQNILFTEARYASRELNPSVIFRSAYSTITIAPSISMPSPSNNPKITIKLYVKSNMLITINAKKNENGTASVTSIPERTPTVAITTKSTSAIAVAIFPERPAFCSRTKGTELFI